MSIFVTASLALLFAIGFCLFAFAAIRSAWRGLGPQRFFAVLAASVVATIVAQKQTWNVSIDNLVADAGCYATNDVFHVAISNSAAYAAIDFSACPVLVYAREHGLTNATDWIELTPRRTFAQLPADYAIVNATNFDYMIYVDYVPPSPVHTNGVFELYGFVIENEAQGEPDQLAAGFINSRTVTPPEEE